MATIVGESGAKKEFLERINDLLKVYTVHKLEDINRLKKSIPQDIERKRLEIKKTLENEKIKLLNNLSILKNNIETIEAETEKEINEDIKEVKNSIEKLDSKLNIDSVLDYLKYPAIKLELSLKKKELNDMILSKESRIKERSSDLRIKLTRYQDRLRQITENFQEIVEYNLRDMYSDLDIVNNLEKHGLLSYYKGAIGEDTVISIIDKNFDEWYVLINNFNFSLPEPVRYHDSWIRNSQLDHVLVCPKGVFAIETKSWSDAYINKVFSDGDFTPIQQIERNCYALYKLLNDHKISYSEIKVKALLISTDKKIPTPQESYVTSITCTYLGKYLKQRPDKLNHKQINVIIKKLSYFI